MSRLAILVTGSSCLEESMQWQRVTDVESDDTPFILSEGQCELGKESWNVYWMRPRERGDHHELLRKLRLKMAVGEENGTTWFRQKIGEGGETVLDVSFDSTEMVVVAIRHWQSLRYEGTYASEWAVYRKGDCIIAPSTLTVRGTSLLFLGSPNIFALDLTAAEERSLKNEGLVLLDDWVNDEMGNLEGEGGYEPREGKLRGIPMQNRVVGMPTKKMSQSDIEQRRLLWMYTNGLEDEEQFAAERACALTKREPKPSLVVVSSDTVLRARATDEGGLVDLKGFVERNDVVLMHGWSEEARSLAPWVERAGVEFVDYSSSDPAWRRFVLNGWTEWNDTEAVRSSLAAYILEAQRKEPALLVRRIVHRGMNNLAPLSLDVSVLNDLAAERDHEGMAAHIGEVGRSWQAERRRHPIWCLRSLCTMLVGDTVDSVEPSAREVVGRSSLGSGSVLVRAVGGEGGFPGDASKVWQELLEKVGLEGRGSEYAVLPGSAIWKYCREISGLVEGDSDINRLVRELVECSSKKPGRDVVAVWSGLDKFSYSDWLQEVSGLLEELYESLE